MHSENASWPDPNHAFIAQPENDSMPCHALEEASRGDPTSPHICVFMWQVLLADQPGQFKLDISALAHHRRLVEKYGGWRPQVGSNPSLSGSMTTVT